MSPEQTWKLEGLEAKSAVAAQQIFNAYEPKESPRKLSAEEQKARDAEYRQKLETLGSDIHRQINETLNTVQRDSLTRMLKEARAAGTLIRALRNSNDAIFDELRTTAEQRARIHVIYSEDAVRQAIPDRATGEKALAILTPEQRKKLDEVIEQRY